MVLNYQLLGNKSVRITRHDCEKKIKEDGFEFSITWQQECSDNTTEIQGNNSFRSKSFGSLSDKFLYLSNFITHICITNDKEKTYLLKYTQGRSVTSRICAGESRTIPGSCPKLPLKKRFKLISSRYMF